jgi:antitoxin PrlF
MFSRRSALEPKARRAERISAPTADQQISTDTVLGSQVGALTGARNILTVRIFLTADTSVITSKLTSKAQTTIPQPIRAALNIAEGDELAYEIRGTQVILTRARRVADADNPFQTFGEWDSDADRKAYGNL